MTALSKKAERKLSALWESDTSDVLELIEHTGLDPTYELRYADFAKADFGDANVAKWDFSGTVLRDAKLSGVKNLEKAIFDTDTDLTGAELPPGIDVSQLLRK